MRYVDADKLYPDCMTKNGTLAISQSQIANAPTVITCEVCKNKGNERECVDCHDYSNFVSLDIRLGEWVPDKDNKKWVCSRCGAVPSDWVNKSQYATTMVNRFCRYCGAKMYKGENNDERICST